MQELQDTFLLAGPMPGVHEATEALMLGAPPTGQAEGEAKCLAVPAAVDHVLVIPPSPCLNVQKLRRTSLL